jgi:hypothetical protein
MIAGGLLALPGAASQTVGCPGPAGEQPPPWRRDRGGPLIGGAIMASAILTLNRRRFLTGATALAGATLLRIPRVKAAVGDLDFASALGAARAIRRGEVSSVELTTRMLDRIRQHNPRICRAACPSTTKAQRRFVAITLSNTSRSPPAIGRSGMMPAQFTTTSIVPNVFIASLKRRSTSVALATSACTAIPRPASRRHLGDHLLGSGRIARVVHDDAEAEGATDARVSQAIAGAADRSMPGRGSLCGRHQRRQRRRRLDSRAGDAVPSRRSERGCLFRKLLTPQRPRGRGRAGHQSAA